MIYKTSRLADLFINSEKALVNARDNNQIYPRMVKYKMSDKRINQGLALLKKLVDSDKKKRMPMASNYRDTSFSFSLNCKNV